MSGSALRMISMITGVLIALYMMPFLVRTLGERWYGFWTIAGSIVGYYTVLDLGLTQAAHRFLAVAHARGDQRETSRVFSTALFLFCAGGLVALGFTGIGWLVAPRFADPLELETIRKVILLLGLNFSLGFPVAVFNGVLAANLRYDLTSYLHLAKLVLRSVLVVIALRMTPSLEMLALVTLGTDVLMNVATAATASRLWPWLQVSPRLFDRGKVREFYEFGLFSFFARIGDMVRVGVDGLIVGAFYGLTMVTHYSIAARLTDYFREILTAALAVLMPVFSRYHSLNDQEALFNRVRQASRLAVAMTTSVAGAAIIFGAPFIERWMGAEFLDAYWPLVILVCASLVAVMQAPTTSYLFATAHHRYYAALNTGDALAKVILSILLAPRLGMVGVALGTAIPAMVSRLVVQPRYVCSLLGLSYGRYWKELGGVLVKSILLQLPIAAIVWSIHPATYLTICGLAFVLYAAHGLLVYLFVLWPEDQAMLGGAVPALGKLTAMRRRMAAAVGRGSP